MFIAIVVLALSSNQDNSTFQILGNSFDGRTLYAIRASPNGENVACRSQDALNSSAPVVLLGARIEVVPRPKGTFPDCVAISNEGSLLANAHFTGAPAACRSYVYQDGQVRWLLPDENRYHSLEATGMTRDGRVIASDFPGTANQNPPPYHSRFGVADGNGWRPIFDEYLVNHPRLSGPGERVITDTPLGYVADLIWPRISGHGYSGGGPRRPAYIRNGQPNWFDVPNAAENAQISACNPSGEIVAGTIDAVGTIWRNGTRLPVGPGSANPQGLIIESIDDRGDVGVGGRNFRSGSVAVICRDEPGTYAVIWREKTGFSPLRDYLVEKGVDVPKEWQLIDAVFVSGDGRTIIGSAKDKSGTVRPFRVTLPPN